jgi:hypothetical protein
MKIAVALFILGLGHLAVKPTKTTFSVNPELTYDWETEQWLALSGACVSG